MTLHEEVTKKRKEYFATATTKEKLAYLVQYYGLRTLLICIAVIFIGSWIYHLITDPDVILNGTFVNYTLADTTVNQEELANDFLASENIDPSEYVAEIQTNITIIQSEESYGQGMDQALYTQIASGVLDYAVGGLDVLGNYAYGYNFADLTTILSKEQIELFEPYFLYIDLAVLEERQEKMEDIPFPDFKKPDDMKQPIPVLLDISHFPIIQEIYGEDCSDICYGIIKKGEHQENAIKFLEYLSEKTMK